ncbi:MAG: hypothetical protein U9O95_00670 [Candidatus Marinimicrobia bacterium]|nr:hypothetical protein [Candidatus Neomarinimicrobiota bacterium]
MIKVKPYKIILLIGLLVSTAFSNDIFFAEIYAEGEPDRLVYTHTNTVEQKGDSTIIDHFYYTPDGKLYVLDKVILLNDEPIFNSLDFYQIKEYSSFTRNGEKAELFFERNGKKKNATRKLRHPLVFAPTQQNAIREHLNELLKGESARFNVFASEVLRLVEMKVQLVKNSKYDREGCIALIMRPRSIFIDWFVDEVFYVVEISTGRIMEMHGFSTLRRKINDKWEFRDMDFYYSYE